jgi:hypothetical protein
MIDDPPLFDAAFAAYVAEHAWTIVRDNDAGRMGEILVFAIRASKSGKLVAEATWFGIRSQLDAERRMLPFLREFDAIVGQIAESSGTPEETILAWIADGWLKLTRDSVARARDRGQLPRGPDLTEDQVRRLWGGD